MCVRCAEGVIHHHGNTVCKPNPAGLSTIGETEMLGKKFIYKRSVMIALTVFALMTLTAGVAAAASMKAKFDALGTVDSVGFAGDATVVSKFKIKNDLIKSINIHTNGEMVGGEITSVFNCTGECSMVDDALLNGIVSSTHESKAKLNVTFQPGIHPFAPPPTAFTHPLWYLNTFEVVGGDLKGSLKAKLDVEGSEGTLSGKANLKIKSTATSYYACADGPPSAIPPFGLGPIAHCADEAWVAAGAILVPVELHVVDTGNFNVKNDSVKVSGKIAVTVNHPVPLAPVGGSIEITKGKATFKVD